MALAIATIANSIAALSVTGVTIKDIDEIPVGVDPNQPTIIPLPDYMTNFDVEIDSFGPGSTAKMSVYYTLNYRLCYKPADAGRSDTIEYYDNMVAAATAFLDAVLAADTVTGSIDVKPEAITNMGIVNDPADNSFHGCDIGLRVMEFVN